MFSHVNQEPIFDLLILYNIMMIITSQVAMYDDRRDKEDFKMLIIVLFI